METYQFVVWERNKFDFGRIIKEMEVDEPGAIGFLLTAPKHPVAAVVLYKLFLEKFVSPEGVLVGSEPLSEHWGDDVKHVIFDYKTVEGFWIDPKGIRGRPSSNGGRSYADVKYAFVSVKEIPRVLEQIRTARNFDEQKAPKMWHGENKKGASVRVKAL